MTKARTLADNFAADINGITAGTGITGGGTSGTVTVTNSMATAIDAKGDLVVGTGADTFSRLAVASTAGYLLSVDSGESTGLKWAAPASSGSLTQLATGTLSGAEVTVSSISGSYKQLQIVVRDVLGANQSALRLRFNGDAGANYQTGVAGAFTYAESSMIFASQTHTSGDSLIWAEIPDYANTATPKIMRTFGVTQNSGTPNYNLFTHFSSWNDTSAINSVTFRYGSGNIASGTYFIYGVN